MNLSMNRSLLNIAMAVAVGLTTMTSTLSAAEEEQRKWKWLGAWPFPDCEYICDQVKAGCLTNPDCKCDCFQ